MNLNFDQAPSTGRALYRCKMECITQGEQMTSPKNFQKLSRNGQTWVLLHNSLKLWLQTLTKDSMCEHLSVDIEKRTYLLRGSRRNQKTFKNAQKITKLAIIRNIVCLFYMLKVQLLHTIIYRRIRHRDSFKECRG